MAHAGRGKIIVLGAERSAAVTAPLLFEEQNLVPERGGSRAIKHVAERHEERAERDYVGFRFLEGALAGVDALPELALVFRACGRPVGIDRALVVVERGARLIHPELFAVLKKRETDAVEAVGLRVLDDDAPEEGAVATQPARSAEGVAQAMFLVAGPSPVHAFVPRVGARGRERPLELTARFGKGGSFWHRRA